MGLPNGVHHLAICTKNMKEQIEFFTQVVGMELVALYWMHGVKNTYHGFLKLGDSSSIAFVQGPESGEIQPIMGVSHASWTAAPVAPGAMQHLALNVETEADLLTMRDRLRSHGRWVWGPLDHGFCKSIYFAGPEGLMLEFSTSEGQLINARAWIDRRWCGSTASMKKSWRVTRTRRGSNRRAVRSRIPKWIRTIRRCSSLPARSGSTA